MANKKVFTDESLATFVSEIKSYTNDIASKKANTTHSHAISDVTNLQTTLDGKASTDVVTQSTIGLMSAEDKTQLDYGGIPIVSASSSDGVIYTATVDGMNALTVGMKVTIIPVISSASTTPKLNVNGLGEKTIRMPVTYNTSATSVGAIETWLSKNKPITVTYNGIYWITTDLPRPSAQYLYGAVPIENGGTGATTATGALTNLGLTSTATVLNGLDGRVTKIETEGVSVGDTLPLESQFYWDKDEEIPAGYVETTPPFSNPNLLINSDFRNPINQRGYSTYVGTDTAWNYTIDRWRIQGAALQVKVSSTQTTFTNSSSSQWYFMQKLEKTLPQDYYTISLKVNSISGSCIINMENSQGVSIVDKNITSTGIISFTGNGAVGGVTITPKANSSISIEWVKLEQGSIATPFVPRPYAEELAMCKRYFVKYHEESMHSAVSVNSQIYLSIQNSFRTKPTLKLTTINCYIPATDAYPVITSNVQVYTYSKTNSTILTVSDSNLGSGQVVFPYACYFELDAEIY